MNKTIERLLGHTVEIEGLLHVAEHHGIGTPDVVLDRLREHIAALSEMADELTIERLCANDDLAASFACHGSDDSVSGDGLDDNQTLPCDDFDADDNRRHDADDEQPEIFSSDDYQEPPHSTPPAPAPVVEPVAEVVPQQQIPVAEVVPPPAPSFKPANVEATPPPYVSVEIEATPPAPAQQPLRVDEKLQRSLSQDLRKALSINDRFRFKRELFGNSDAELNDALNLVQAMSSYDEAQQYFIDNLGWDADEEVVADFMNMVGKHFNQ